MPEAVVLMAYGTPADRDDVEAYYTHIRRGRPPTPEQLGDLVRRYDAIGGVSPLAARTEAQRAGLQRALDAQSPGRFRVVLGFKHVSPFIEDAVEEAVAGGATRLVGLVLAPHFSALSVGEYLHRLTTAAGERADVRTVRSWAIEPAYVSFLADQLRALPPKTKVLFTAHSLPERVRSMGDPYEDQLRATAGAVAAEAGLPQWAGWTVAWQSAGRTPEPWLGPDVNEVIRDLGETGRADGVVVCPCGFVADHLEVLYDLDVESRATAESVGLSFRRTAVPNDHPGVLAALAGRVLDT